LFKECIIKKQIKECKTDAKKQIRKSQVPIYYFKIETQKFEPIKS